MRYHQTNTSFNCGIDLHARSMYVCIIDPKGNAVLHQNIRNNERMILDQEGQLVRTTRRIASRDYTLLQTVPVLCEDGQLVSMARSSLQLT